ncbi:MAG: hypothetical protein GAK45_01216 [Pseudomonas citronellolis]|nr:MAG: hypothetical protein GAK45_01216 [Pseudomonas citronellolis]
MWGWSAMDRRVPRIVWLSLLSRCSCCIASADCWISRHNALTLATAPSIWPCPACAWRWPLSADSAAWLQERATSLEVMTISWKAVDTISTASRWREAASDSSPATPVALLELLWICPAAWPMCWINWRMLPRNWLNQPASRAVSSRPRTSRLRVRSPSPWAIPSRPWATWRIGRAMSSANQAPPRAKSTAATPAIRAMIQVMRAAPPITSLSRIRPMNCQSSALEL